MLSSAMGGLNRDALLPNLRLVNTMPTTLTLIGDIPVATGVGEAVDKLIADIDIDDADIDYDGSFLSIHIDETVTNSTPERVLDLVAAFIREHSTAGAVFDYGDGATLTFGPAPEARRAARLAYLQDMVEIYEAALEQETCRDMCYWQPEVI